MRHSYIRQDAQWVVLFLLILCVVLPHLGRAAEPSAAEDATITLLHTNDIHSHFRPDAQAPYLGGLARMKTLINRIRQSSTASLLVDGGDWTEGQLYYYLGAGLESYKMMDRMGYDVAVIGNHDWLNGADTLLKVLRESGLRTTPVAANLAVNAYAQGKEFRERVPEFTIRELHGVKIAFFGLLTYEFIYDTFLNPMKITSPFDSAKKLSEHLKKDLGVDYVVAISHNSLAVNRKILEVAPQLDLIIGAHDHKKLPKPIQVQRIGTRAGWLVETGCWGHYLGRIQLQVKGKRIAPVSAELLPIDSTLEEDPEVFQSIEKLESRLEDRYGPIFHDHVADSETDFQRLGAESEMGDLVADAIRERTGADLAVEHQRFVYSTLAIGPLRTADIFNASPAVYSPTTGRSWTIRTLQIQGSTLQFLFNLLLSPQKFADGNEPSFSGMRLIYESPFHIQDLTASSDFRPFAKAMQTALGVPVVKQMLIDGRPVVPTQRYRMAFSGGLHETLVVLNQLIPGLIPVEQVQDTGFEAKEALKEFVIRHSPISTLRLDFGKRLQPQGPDIALQPATVQTEVLRQDGARAAVRLRFKLWNLGLTASAAQKGAVQILGHSGSSNPLIEVAPVELVPPLDIRALPPGAAQTFEVSLKLPMDQGPVPIRIQVARVGDEVNLTNNEWVAWFNSKATK